MKRIINILIKILSFFTPKRFHRFLTYEAVSYLLFGGLTTIVAFVFFVLFFHIVGMRGASATAVSDVLAVVFAFVTNKLWVFESKSWELKIFIPELIKFGLSRGFTIVLGILAMYVLVDRLGFHAITMRLITMILIQVIGNYVLSKWLVFTNKGE